MPDTYTQVPPDSTGDKIDGSPITQPGYPEDGLGGSQASNVVVRQRVTIGDPAEPASLARVTGKGGLSVENAELHQLERIANSLDEILFILKTMAGA